VRRTVAFVLALLPAAAVSFSAHITAAPMIVCDRAHYVPRPGLRVDDGADGLTVSWSAEGDRELRLLLTIDAGTPVIRSITAGRGSGGWTTIATNLTPEYRIVSGFRRMSHQQLQPLEALGVAITPAIVDEKKWDAFWDAPLDLNPEAGRGRGGNPPPAAGIANQPGLPRKASEVARAIATYRADSCTIATDGSRIEVAFAGFHAGVFDGRLQFTVYKGTSLIRMEAIAKTDQPSVAYKYDAGLKGFALRNGARVMWHDLSGARQTYQFGGADNESAVPLKAANRTIVAEQVGDGAIAAFPPPHTFFWAREIATNLGYSWYRKDSDRTFSFGVRQAEREESAQYDANFALYSARPGTWQRMPVYFYASADSADRVADAVLAFTHGDRYKALPGYQVMNHHYHMDLGQRLLRAGSLDAEIPDLEILKSLGLNIVSQIDSVGTGGPSTGSGQARAGPDQLAITAASMNGARRHSDKDFLVLANQEFYNSPLGGHTDLLFSHPVYWTQGRAAGQPLFERVPEYGIVYHVASADDLMEMARREDVMISMPHPRTKGSTGFPDAIKDQAPFKDPHYQGIGFRWGMGLDGSERRLCEYRCLPLLDEMSNWVADLAIPPKYALSISEVRYQSPGDDVYASAPVSYVKLDAIPATDAAGAVVKALMRGDYTVTSGEVLIRSFAVQGSGAARTVSAEIEWTFPMEMVEVVWGDGKTTDRQIISATDAPPFGRRRFDIPLDATGKKWVRFAAWDSAGNGAITQPVKLAQ
jgi:hypothetical protein